MTTVAKLKPLYIIAGSSDGYNYIQYTFNEELANRMTVEEEDYQGMDSGPDTIMVPASMTYAELGITDPLEEDFEE